MTEEEKVEVKTLINEHNKAIDERISSQEQKLDELLSRQPWWHYFFSGSFNVFLGIFCKGILLGLLVFYLVIYPIISD